MKNTLKHVSAEELTKWMSEFLQIDTTNPPGNEELAAKYIEEILVQEDLQPQLFYSEDNRANLYLRIKGENPEAKLMLTAHTDVVPAEQDTWRYPPFSGKVIDNEIWGRGAIDCKGLAIMEMGAIIEMVRAGKKPKNDLIMLFVADEEVGGLKGAKYMIDNHPELVKVEYIINEGGGVGIQKKDAWQFLLNNAEKGAYWGWIEVEGRPGHGSIPRAALNAAEEAAKVVLLLRDHRTKIDPSEDVLTQIARLGGGKIGKFLFSHQRITDFIINHPIGSLKSTTPLIDAMIRPTITPTMLEASNKVNVIPGKAKIGLDCRLLPGQDWSTVEQEVARALKGKVKYTIHQEKDAMGMMGSSSSFDTPLKQVIEDIIVSKVDNAVLIPFQVSGATDSRYFRNSIKAIAYGFSPLKVGKDFDEFMTMFHGRNERISIDNLVFGTEILYELIERFA